MACPACDTDYQTIEREIENGRLSGRDQVLQRLTASVAGQRRVTVVYCPGCREKIQRLMDRVSSRLRKQTIAGIHDLLEQAHERRENRG